MHRHPKEAPLTATSVDSPQMKVYQDDSTVLFAFDVADADRVDLVGFIIQYMPQSRVPYQMPDRLVFDTPIHVNVPLKTGKYTDSIDTPFQSFRQVHSPPHTAA